jgi:hypothetical protein
MVLLTLQTVVLADIGHGAIGEAPNTAMRIVEGSHSPASLRSIVDSHGVTQALSPFATDTKHTPPLVCSASHGLGKQFCRLWEP